MEQEFEAVFVKIETIIQAKKIPKLKTLMRGAINNISNLINLLVRKSYLKENLYNYAENSENTFYLPEEKPFEAEERSRIMYDRLKAYIDAIEFVTSNLPGEVEDYTPEIMKRLIKILNYFSFHSLSGPSAGLNSRTLKEMTDRIIASKDQILRRVVQDNLKLLTDNYIKIKQIVDEIGGVHKERYKAQVRFKVFPFLKEEEFTYELLKENPSQFITKLAKYLQLNSTDVSLHKNWIAEAINSCYTISNEDELDRIKNTFLKEHEKKTINTGVLSNREKLLKIVDQIATTSSILEKIVMRFEQNLKYIYQRKKNLIEQMVDVFKKAVSNTNQDEIFQLEYINPTNKSIENDTVNIHDFMNLIKKKIALFRSISDSNSNLYEKVRRGTEEALYKFIEDTYFELLLTKERIVGLNGEIRLRLPKKVRLTMKDMVEPIEKLTEILTKVSEARRKYVMEQDGSFNKGHKKG